MTASRAAVASFEISTRLVKAGDPDRFLSAQATPQDQRAEIMAIYALNLEIARAPWASQEPLVAQMRLRWWGDAIAGIYQGKSPDSHEILPALCEVIYDHNLPQNLFETLIDARHFDLYSDPHETQEAFDSYINATSGTAMELAARVLGATPEALKVIKEYSYGVGVASLLRAAPELIARGRNPLLTDTVNLVTHAQQKIITARKQKHLVAHKAKPALLAGWRADATLSEAAKRPESITAGLLEESPARRMATLRWRKLTGRW